jgi:hypothetical protein
MLGAPFAYFAPGSVVNVGVYYGCLIDGLQGALLSIIFIYIPCLLSLYGILPQWNYYRNKSGIQRVIKGLTCVGTGFCLGMVNMYLIKVFIILK